MSSFVKTLAVLAAVFILIFGAAAIYLFTIFDPNDYKSEIQSIVKEHTQLDLKIDGDLSLSVFPWLGVSVGSIEVNTPEGPLVSAKHAQVFAKLKPLLSGELEVDGLTLNGLKLQLVVDKNGKGNWDIAAPVSTAQKPSAQEPAHPESVSPVVLPLAALSVGHISIEGANIDYRDLQNSQHHQIQNLDLRVSNINLNQAFPITADLNYKSSEKAMPIPVHITTKVLTNLSKQTAHLKDMVIDVNSTRFIGEVDASDLLMNPVIEAQLRINDFQLNKWSKILENPDLANISLPINMETALTLNTEKDTLDISTLKLVAGNLNATGTVSVTKLSESPSYSGKLNAAPFDLKELLKQLGQEAITTTDKDALKKVGANLVFNGTESSLNLPSLSLTLDKTQIDGNASITNFDKPAYTYKLSGTSLNVDSYLPPSEEPSKESSTAKSESETSSQQISGGEALLLPLAAMRDLNINGSIRLKQLIASGLTMENISASTSALNGFIRIKSLTGDIYDGTFSANGTIDARGNSPQITMKKQLRQMNAGPVLKTLGDIDFVTGKLDLDIMASTHGNTQQKITNNLNGDITFSVTDGILKDISLEQMVCDGIARIRQLEANPPAENASTVFKDFSGRMTVSNGIVHTDQLDIATDAIKARGTGTVNLSEQTLDYGLRAKVLGALENKSCEVNERYRDIEWPVKCQGPWDAEPSDLCGIDRTQMTRIIGKLAEKELKSKANKEIERAIKDKLGDELGDQLKNLLKF